VVAVENQNPNLLSELDDLMVRLVRLAQSQNGLKKTGLTPTQSYILRHLVRHGETKASDLARASGLSPGAVTQVCDELEKTNLVLRYRSVDDRRVVQHDITENGREVLKQLTMHRQTLIRHALGKVSEAEARGFLRVVEAMVDQLEIEKSCPEA
jgi:MarR family transcriptional regulator, 2-MHQ and catechol-resistance regulon repressor